MAKMNAAESNHIRNLQKSGRTKSRGTRKGNARGRTSRSGTGKRL